MTNARARLAATAAALALLLLFALQASPAGAAGNADPGPPGNNGTVKLDGTDLADGPGHTSSPNDPGETEPDNDPHLRCGFQLEFFGFDAGQLADITFTAHRPTGSGGVLLAQTGVLISDDGAAGAAGDPDVVLDYDVRRDFDTTQFHSVHAQHGWHVKLDLVVRDADGRRVPGGQKHKVFWVEGCQPAPQAEAPAVPETPGPELPGTPAGSDAPVTEAPTPVPPTSPDATGGRDVEQPAPPQGDVDAGEDGTPAGTPSVVLSEVLTPGSAGNPAAAAGTGDTQVLGASTARTGTLPRTGTDATTVLALAGLGLVVAGTVVARSGRLGRN